MRPPAGYVSRPARWEDLDEVVLLLKACDLADVGFEQPVRENVEQEWRKQGFDLDRHTAVVIAGEGTLVAYAEVFGQNAERAIESFARVHPAHRARGLGSALLAWIEQRARALVPPGAAAVLQPHVPGTDEDARRLLAAHGFGVEPVRVFWHMERSLAGAIEVFGMPAGIEVREYRHQLDAEAVLEALNESFAGHWGVDPLTPDAYDGFIRGYEPELVEVALHGDEVVAVVIAKTVERGGWVDVVGVRPAWRGRGIARALLVRSFGALAARGAETVTLNVDSENESGATRLYESVGMRVLRAWLAYEKPIRGDVS